MKSNKRPPQTEDKARKDAIYWASVRMEEEGAPPLPTRNRIQRPVQPILAPDDASIARKVKEALLKARNLRIFDLVVECENGNVTLSGYIDSHSTHKRVTAIAEKIRGVRHVTIKLKVRETRSKGSGKEFIV